MNDIVDAATRSRMMSGIRSTNTRPEQVIRKELHRRGFRFRLHSKNLPGTPDIVLPKYNAVIFVHGCLWHRHNCHLFRWPATRPEFWRKKIDRNVENDERALKELRNLGWRTATVWECSLKGKLRRPEQMFRALNAWLRGSRKRLEISG